MAVKDMNASTAWTPARGDVVGWPFVWRNPASVVKERACVLLALPSLADEMVVMALSNLAKLDPTQPWIEVAWTGRDGAAKRSVLYRRNAEVNLVPAQTLVVARDGEGKPINWGGMDGRMAATVERRMLGGIVAATTPAIPGWRFGMDGSRESVVLRRSDEGGIKVVALR